MSTLSQTEFPCAYSKGVRCDPSAAPSGVPGTEGQDSPAPDPGQDQPLPQVEDQQQNLPHYSDEEQQQGPYNTTEEDSRGEDVSDRSQDPGQNTRSPDFTSVPWTT